MSAILGVDPTATHTGAAALRVDGVVIAWWVWTSVKAGWRVRHDVPGQPHDPAGLDSLESVGAFVSGGAATYGRVHLVVEGLHGPPRWKQRTGRGMSAKDLITLAEATGRTIAGLARYCGEPIARPTWKEWTAPFGLDRLNEKAAERAVLEMAMREGWLPRGLTGAEQVSVAECGLISRWGEK